MILRIPRVGMKVKVALTVMALMILKKIRSEKLVLRRLVMLEVIVVATSQYICILVDPSK
jgi:hypothetical protein